MDNRGYELIIEELLKLLDSGVYIVDADGRGLFYNEAMAAMEEINVEDVVGKEYHRAFPGVPLNESTLYKALNKRLATRNKEQTYKNLYGKEITTINSTVPVIDGGQVVAAVEVAKDITNIRSMSDRILTLQETKIERSRQNLTGIVLLAIRTFEKSEQYNVKIYLHDSGAPVFADVNSWEIEFVILNLFKNSGEALKASGRNRIDVTVTQDEYHAVVRVSDNGIGLDDEAMKKIFQPLFSTKVNGMGMGLSIALRIVESHGGRMNAFRNKNHGLTIEIVLPLSKDAENECYE